MSSAEYVKQVEKENEELRTKLFRYDTLRDIIASKVTIVESEVINSIDPKNVCEYLEKNKWTLNYEKTHERYVTRSYFSPHRDIKVKIYVRDHRPDCSVRRNEVALKIKDTIGVLARIHKKGELEVIYEILTGDIRERLDVG